MENTTDQSKVKRGKGRPPKPPKVITEPEVEKRGRGRPFNPPKVITEPEVEVEKKNRGRPAKKKEDKKVGRFIKCDHCNAAIYYDYRDPKFKVAKEVKCVV